MSRKSFVAGDFLRKWAEKVCGERFPQGNGPKKFVASDFLRQLAALRSAGFFAPTFSIFTHSGYTFAPVRTNDT